MSDMTLWGYDRSTYVRTVKMVLAEKGVTEFNQVQLNVLEGDPKKPEHLERHPFGNIGTILLGRPQALFLNRSPSRRRLTWIVARHTDTPRCCRSSSRISTRVMSGLSVTSARSSA